MSFQPPSKSLTTRDYIFITVVVLLFIAISLGLYNFNLSLPNGGGEFLRHWAGGRAFIFDRFNPYEGEVPARVQQLVYEGNAGAGDEPYILDTPFHLLLLYFPFSLLSDPLLARAIYTLILEWALFALVVLSLRLTDWTVPRWFAPLFFLFCVANFYTYQSILDASPILMLAFFFVCILFTLQNGQDEVAGALISFSLYYWEVGLPFLLFIAWYAYKTHRTRIFAGFGMFSFITIMASIPIFPDWFIPYLRAGMNNLRADFGYSIFSAFTELLPSFGNWLAWVVIVILIIALGSEWNAAIQRDDPRRFYWTACLSLAAAPLLGFRTQWENLAVLIIPLALIFAIIHDRWRAGNLLIVLFLLIWLLVPWVLVLYGIPAYGEIVNQLIFLLPPLFTVVGLYWIRWWAIRPPRIWADAVVR
ncbi:MAG: DUF2029 domain-containing protein [Anaerolineae bacterium]|nr:DUF2029 domain-containing protein [Anaerolineae bacterium]